MTTGNPTPDQSTKGATVEKPKGIEDINSRINAINLELSGISKKAREELTDLQDSGGSQDDYSRISAGIGANNTESVKKLQQELKDLEESKRVLEAKTGKLPREEFEINEEHKNILEITEENGEFGVHLQITTLDTDSKGDESVRGMYGEWDFTSREIAKKVFDFIKELVPTGYVSRNEAQGIKNRIEEFSVKVGESKEGNGAKTESGLEAKAREAGMTVEEYKAKRKEEDENKIGELRKKLGINN